jgi:hypothetical protein
MVLFLIWIEVAKSSRVSLLSSSIWMRNLKKEKLLFYGDEIFLHVADWYAQIWILIKWNEIFKVGINLEGLGYYEPSFSTESVAYSHWLICWCGESQPIVSIGMNFKWKFESMCVEHNGRD